MKNISDQTVYQTVFFQNVLNTLKRWIQSQCLMLLIGTKVVKVAKCRVDREGIVDCLVPRLLGLSSCIFAAAGE